MVGRCGGRLALAATAAAALPLPPPPAPPLPWDPAWRPPLAVRRSRRGGDGHGAPPPRRSPARLRPCRRRCVGCARQRPAAPPSPSPAFQTWHRDGGGLGEGIACHPPTGQRQCRSSGCSHGWLAGVARPLATVPSCRHRPSPLPPIWRAVGALVDAWLRPSAGVATTPPRRRTADRGDGARGVEGARWRATPACDTPARCAATSASRARRVLLLRERATDRYLGSPWQLRSTCHAVQQRRPSRLGRHASVAPSRPAKTTETTRAIKYVVS